MPQPPLTLTCIIPCFNVDPDLLTETLVSLQAATFQNFHLILVDDGSTDTRFHRRALALFPSAQILRHSHNRGLSAARNTGVARITGAAACQTPFYLQLDADDLIEPTYLEKALWALITHPQWAFCNSWARHFGRDQSAWQSGFERGPEFLEDNFAISTAVIRRESDRAIGGHDETIREGCEDWDYWLRMAAAGQWGGTLPEHLVHYRQNDPPTYWPNRDDPVRRAQFRQALRRRYPHLSRRTWPKLQAPPEAPILDSIPDEFKTENIAPRGERSDRHILLFMPWMTLGGADRFNLLLLEQLQERGYTFTLCTTASGPHPWLDHFTRFTSDTFILANFLPLAHYPRFLRYLLASRPIGTVVIAGSQLAYGLLPYLRSHFPQVVFLDFVHMVDLAWRAGGYARAAVNQHPSLDLTIASSQQVRGWIAERVPDPTRVEVCTTNVDVDLWDPARFNRADLRRALALSESQPVILYAARLAPQKRPRLLVAILTALVAQGQPFHCLIAGDGPEYRWLKRAITVKPLQGRVTLLGLVEPDRMAELMAASDLFLLPSQAEGIALTLYEAMAMGLPVVAAAVGGQAELVTPGTGVLIPPGADELNAYVDTVRQLLQSPARRGALGAAARQRVVDHFTAQHLADRLIQLLAQARELHTHHPRPAIDAPTAFHIAQNVISAEYQSRLAENLFAESAADWTLGTTQPIGTRRQRLARALKHRLLNPLYQWGLAHGLEWLVPLKNRLYRLVGQRR